MNFYQHQQRARRRTALLVVYFVLAVALITLALNAVVYLASSVTATTPLTLAAWLRQPAWLWVTIGCVGLMVLASLYTALRLRGGGPALAQAA